MSKQVWLKLSPSVLYNASTGDVFRPVSHRLEDGTTVEWTEIDRTGTHPDERVTVNETVEQISLVLAQFSAGAFSPLQLIDVAMWVEQLAERERKAVTG